MQLWSDLQISNFHKWSRNVSQWCSNLGFRVPISTNESLVRIWPHHFLLDKIINDYIITTSCFLSLDFVRAPHLYTCCYSWPFQCIESYITSMSEIAVLRTQSQLPSRLSLIQQFSEKDQCKQQLSTQSINSRYASGDLDGYSIVLYQMSTKPEPHPICTNSRLKPPEQKKRNCYMIRIVFTNLCYFTPKTGNTLENRTTCR